MNKWIPINEGLPTEEGSYLCTLKFGTVTELAYLWCSGRYYWIDMSIYQVLIELGNVMDAIKRAHYDEFVVAWMPTPSPYKGENQ